MQLIGVGKVADVSGNAKAKVLQNVLHVLRASEGKETPLLVVDGEEFSVSSLDKLSPDMFESINVLKEEDAINRFGEKGKNGVLLITTKKK